MSAEDSPSPSSPSESKHSYDGELGRAIRSLFVVKPEDTDKVYTRPTCSEEVEKLSKVKDLSAANFDVSNLFPKDKKHMEKEMAHVVKEIGKLQDILSAQNKYSVLIVLQAMDAGGKDGVVNHVFGNLNPQGVSVVSFKSPTDEERNHDFLWRVHAHTPRRGQIRIFNRSHYEDVLFPVTHDWINDEVREKRYIHIRNFEDLLVDNDTVILKFFLNMSKDEQKGRLEARQNDPTKQWKLTPDDERERKLWDRYMTAYDQLIHATSTPDAPWYVIPADYKPYSRLQIAHIVFARLQELALKYPDPMPNVKDMRFD